MKDTIFFFFFFSFALSFDLWILWYVLLLGLQFFFFNFFLLDLWVLNLGLVFFFHWFFDWSYVFCVMVKLDLFCFVVWVLFNIFFIRFIA